MKICPRKSNQQNLTASEFRPVNLGDSGGVWNQRDRKTRSVSRLGAPPRVFRIGSRYVYQEFADPAFRKPPGERRQPAAKRSHYAAAGCAEALPATSCCCSSFSSIQRSTSAWTHPTARRAKCIGAGNLWVLTKRKIVDRLRPVLDLTSGRRRTRRLSGGEACCCIEPTLEK